METNDAVQNLSLLSQSPSHSESVSLDYMFGNPVFSIVCDTYFHRVEQRGQLLEDTFQSLKSSHPGEIEVLLRQYHGLTAKIEMDKLTAIMNSARSQHQRLNHHYNHQRNKLITIMEKKLKDLQNKSRADSNKNVNWKAVKLMQDWYKKNEHHPYPTAKDIEHIAMLGNISEKDIQTWFYFERMRHSATKSFRYIVRSPWRRHTTITDCLTSGESQPLGVGFSTNEQKTKAVTME